MRMIYAICMASMHVLVAVTTITNQKYFPRLVLIKGALIHNTGDYLSSLPGIN